MKIVLIGYGRMGKEVEKIALARGHHIDFKIDNESEWNTHLDEIITSDVAIDFSMPDMVENNIKRCFSKNLAVVEGTTAWYDKLDIIKDLCLKNDNSFIYASNFSIGVNIFFELNRRLAKIMGNHKEYDLSIEEIHHVHKLDAPSGTAIKLAEDIINNVSWRKEWTDKTIEDAEIIKIKSKREDEVTGTHIIKYDSNIDSLEIKHEAKNRKGFALGAVMAAEWLIGKKGFFEMKDMLGF